MEMEKTMKTLVTILAVVTMTMFSVQAMAVDINGGSSWGGWTLQGASNSLGIYGSGTTSNPYNVYTSVFTYTDNPITGNPSGGAGQGAAGIFGGGFGNGDTVVGIGVQMLGSESVASFLPTLKFDINNDSYRVMLQTEMEKSFLNGIFCGHF